MSAGGGLCAVVVDAVCRIWSHWSKKSNLYTEGSAPRLAVNATSRRRWPLSWFLTSPWRRHNGGVVLTAAVAMIPALLIGSGASTSSREVMVNVHTGPARPLRPIRCPRCASDVEVVGVEHSHAVWRSRLGEGHGTTSCSGSSSGWYSVVSG